MFHNDDNDASVPACRSYNICNMRGLDTTEEVDGHRAIPSSLEVVVAVACPLLDLPLRRPRLVHYLSHRDWNSQAMDRPQE
jgi:hypothetical protein